MIKKILGGFLFLVSALSLIGSISNGTFMSDRASLAATYGTFIGTLLPIIVYVLAGIFLIRFDGVYTKTYIEGFKARKKQCSKIVFFIVIYFVFIFFVAIGAGLSGVDNYFLAYLLGVIPYLVPEMIFAGMLGVYAIPYWACKRNFKLDDSTINEYLSANEVFYSYSDDNSIIASNKVIFLSKTFCIIPFAQINSVEFKNLWVEQDVVFKLKNGKKIEIFANKKKYDNIISAITAHNQSDNL